MKCNVIITRKTHSLYAAVIFYCVHLAYFKFSRRFYLLYLFFQILFYFDFSFYLFLHYTILTFLKKKEKKHTEKKKFSSIRLGGKKTMQRTEMVKNISFHKFYMLNVCINFSYLSLKYLLEMV